MQTQFLLHRSGWADLILVNGPERVEIPISYLTDSPRELLAALRAVLRHGGESSVVFVDELGETILVLRALPGDLVQLKVYRGNDEGEAAGTAPVFRHKLPLSKFATQVVQEFARLLRDHGEAGYRARWTLYDFPRQEFDDVRALLGMAL